MDARGVDPQVNMSASVPIDDRVRCLWIARYLPYPLDEGAKIYSANLAQSLAQAGASVRFLGFGDAAAVPASAAGVEWQPVPGGRRNKGLAVFSPWPIAAAIDGTRAYAGLLDAQLRERWDAVVLDGYGSGWALDRCLEYRAGSRSSPPIVVHVSHNHEEILWRAMATQARGSAFMRWALERNADKVARLERRIVHGVDLLTSITDEDRQSLSAERGPRRSLTLTPGYTGRVAKERCITAATPRRVIIMGSFQWVVKQENLIRFLEIADPIFAELGIELDIVGDVPERLISNLRATCRATHFHGFIADATSLMAAARIAVVPEAIGGGFKLKLLDYIFARIPVATVTQAMAGLPDELRAAMLSSDSISELVAQIVSHLDRPDALNRLQECAFELAKARFRWSARGERFLEAITDVRRLQGCLPAPRNERADEPVNQPDLNVQAQVDA
jgi:glycosyltransferase involved in cell wall biosynthesis